jgi:ubiquitin-conjugating enzyme E2 D/E
LSDKKALDELVKHLHDLIGDLESMTSELRIPERQRFLIQYEIESVSETSVLEIIEESRIGPQDMVSDAASCQLSSNRSIGFDPIARTTASLHNTERTDDSYQTAREYISALGPSVHSNRSQTSPGSAEEEDLSWSASDLDQNKRVMQGLLARARPDGSLEASRSMDLSRSEQLLPSFRADALKKKLRNRLEVLEIPFSTARFPRPIPKELRNLWLDDNKLAHDWVTFQPIANKLNLLLGSVEGPPSTPYARGLFHFVIHPCWDYPLSPPKVLAVTRIYHPNISPMGEVCLGEVCLRVLNDAGSWLPALGIEKVLRSIASILDDPGLEDPLVPEVAETYLRDRSTYEENASLYTQKYANLEYLSTDEGMERCFQMCLKAIGKE